MTNTLEELERIYTQVEKHLYTWEMEAEVALSKLNQLTNDIVEETHEIVKLTLRLRKEYLGEWETYLITKN